jgi:glyoxylase-like metal-dependent hydrolase (beta-lactamase superfamily II)
MRVTEIAGGERELSGEGRLWHWTGLYPDWKPEDGGPDGWPQEVGCVYYEAPDAVVLIDPLVPPEDADRFWAALDGDVERVGRPVVVLLTVDWHSRSAAEILERYGGTRDRPAAVEEISVIGTGGETERLFWLAEHGALVTGDVILGADDGGVRICPDSWLPEELRGEAIRRELMPLLELPVERVLPAHGEPVLEGAREALARALGHEQSSSATAE